MDFLPFVRFTFNSRYILRWLLPSLALYVPVLNFLSLGYLTKMARVLLIGSVGLPTWEDKSSIFSDGLKIVIISVLYEAVPFFILSSGFFLSSLPGIVSTIGKLLMKISYLAFLIFSLPLPFALSAYIDQSDIKAAFDYERIINAIKEVLPLYILGYFLNILALIITVRGLIGITYLGFFLSSATTYYVLILSLYFFLNLFKRTSLFKERLTS